MNKITKIAEITLTRYFNILSLKGYNNYISVYNIILLLFLEELLTDFQHFTSTLDYNLIIKTILLLELKECMIESSKCTDVFFMKDNVY